MCACVCMGLLVCVHACTCRCVGARVCVCVYGPIIIWWQLGLGDVTLIIGRQLRGRQAPHGAALCTQCGCLICACVLHSHVCIPSTCVYVCMHVCVLTCMCVCVHIYVGSPVCICAHMYVCALMYECACACRPHSRPHSHVCMCTHMYVCPYVHMYACMLKNARTLSLPKRPCRASCRAGVLGARKNLAASRR